MKNKKEIQNFKLQLNNLGINMSLDTEVRDDGKRLENYVFEYEEQRIKIIEPIINRDFGRSKEIISDINFYKEWVEYLLKEFKK